MFNIKKISIAMILVVSIISILNLTSCGGGGGGTATLSSIAVTTNNLTAVVHGGRQFTATGTYSDGSTANITTSVTWTSSDTAVATIKDTEPTTADPDAKGFATAKALGTSTITATSPAATDEETDITGSAVLTVSNIAANTFVNGGATLTTAVTEPTTTSKSVAVTDSNGTNVLNLTVSQTGVTMSAPGQDPATTTMTFRTPLTTVPTPYCAEQMAIFAAGAMATPNFAVMPDSPGCDWFPDTQCTLGCCAEHDQCYRANNCGASSWIWGFGTDACKNCNSAAYDCIGAACAGVTVSFVENNCFDARCNKTYDCPPNYNTCACKDICAERSITPPETCGNGVCAADETAVNCWIDCAAGNSLSQCCIDSLGCPSETPTECPGACCCCGWGMTCNTENVCAAGDFY